VRFAGPWLATRFRSKRRSELTFDPKTSGLESAKFVTSELTCTERPPARSIYFWAEDSAAAPSLPWTTSLALYCANDIAIAAPMPCKLPVTSAT
jgi:hypothetical protein